MTRHRRPFAIVATAASLSVLLASPARAQTSSSPAPLRLAIAGLVHGHVRGFLRSVSGRTDVQVVGVAEPDAALRAEVLAQFKLPASIGFPDVASMLEQAKPEAVATFTSTADHPQVVEACARRRVPVMMEKPLAVSVADGERIRRAAEDGRIPVIVNYETTWYPGLAAAAHAMQDAAAVGPIRKMVAMDGHQGPKEIGVGPEFLRWLTDPVQNGAGALFDFGCYGANIMTWLMGNQRPVAVTATTQRFKPAIYPLVDDEATIVVEYPGAQGIIQASWNWPFNRKDFEVYTERAYAVATGANGLRLRLPGSKEEDRAPQALPADEADPVSYLLAVARGRVTPSGRSSLENNLVVTEILAAARESAQTGHRVVLR